MFNVRVAPFFGREFSVSTVYMLCWGGLPGLCGASKEAEPLFQVRGCKSLDLDAWMVKVQMKDKSLFKGDAEGKLNRLMEDEREDGEAGGSRASEWMVQPFIKIEHSGRDQKLDQEFNPKETDAVLRLGDVVSESRDRVLCLIPTHTGSALPFSV
ncbi:hypothetical protein P7K49_003804 [Saguinus oedipus]|uniref:Uncharacterized protein n=1 Tax=Saguinus oedipus TaxID=9490 RepID=A0ABQ9W7Z5_SAGOE|nr:hypothetical protein P7K49_003804 [Saguinus oedipus]